MGQIVERKMKVLKAEYAPDAESIAIVGETVDGRGRYQIPATAFTFGDKDVATEMIKLAELMIDRTITMQFDPDLTEKLEDGDDQ